MEEFEAVFDGTVGASSKRGSSYNGARTSILSSGRRKGSGRRAPDPISRRRGNTPERANPSQPAAPRHHGARVAAYLKSYEEQRYCERQAAWAARTQCRASERETQEAERQLGSVLLRKRAMMATGEIAADTSRQGLSPFDVPTEIEKVSLRLVSSRLLAEPEPEPEQEPQFQLNTIRRVAPDWPSPDDRALLTLANEKRLSGDVCAARLLARWAVATWTDDKSLTYMRPKLAHRLRRLDELAATWQKRHAAYLPLLLQHYRTPVNCAQPAPGRSEPPRGQDQRRVLAQSSKLRQAQQRLVLAMASLDHNGVSPLKLLDHDSLLMLAHVVDAHTSMMQVAKPQWAS
eukprot:COSAG04_NODE_3840_length_2483_cov_2.932466_3_plen_346_part_00